MKIKSNITKYIRQERKATVDNIKRKEIASIRKCALNNSWVSPMPAETKLTTKAFYGSVIFNKRAWACRAFRQISHKGRAIKNSKVPVHCAHVCVCASKCMKSNFENIVASMQSISRKTAWKYSGSLVSTDTLA